MALGAAPSQGALSGSVTGIVRDSAGIPQIGAEVQLLRPDLTVLLSVYTNSSGRFTIPSVTPGRYAVKAMGASFLPALRENVRVRSITVVNLTLNTLYEVMQWLPAEPRGANSRRDDWAWTLRSAANRPLLHWLEDGPLVVVSDGTGTAPKLKARLMATGQAGTFGESGERYEASVEATPSNSREFLARVAFDPATDAGMESMLGFRQDLGFAGSVQSLAAVAIHPEIEGTEAGGAAGLQEAAVRTEERLHLGDMLEAEVGSNQVLARFARNSPNTVAAVLPYAMVGWREGKSTIRYRMATGMSGEPDEGAAGGLLPMLSMRDGQLALERGMHQEISWERRTDESGMTVMVFTDRVENPVLEAMGEDGAGLTASWLVDNGSGLMHVAGPEYSSAGMMASFERRLPGGNQIRLSYANGNALVMAATQGSGQASMAELVAAAHTRHAQMYALSLSGTLEGTGTRWWASYRWQPEDTLSPVGAFARDADQPYLNLHVSQPIHLRRDGSSGLVALLDLRNLLAQGYRPYVLSDGSLLVFAEDRRSIRAGLAFNF